MDLIPGIINVFSFRTIKSEKLPPPLNEIFIHVWFENFFHSFQNLTYLFLHLLPFLILFLIMFFFFFFKDRAVFHTSFHVVWIKLNSSQVNFLYPVSVTLKMVCFPETRARILSKQQEPLSMSRTSSDGAMPPADVLHVFHLCATLGKPPLTWYTCVRPITFSVLCVFTCVSAS